MRHDEEATQASGLSVADQVAIEVRAQVLGLCAVLAFVAAIAAFASPSLHASAGWIAVPGYTAFAGRLHLLRQLPPRNGQQSRRASAAAPTLEALPAAGAAFICAGSSNPWALGLLVVVFVGFQVVQFPANKKGATNANR